MKKLIYSLLTVIALATTTTSATAKENKPKTELTATQKLELKRLTNRVEEIRSMDKTALSKAERKALKQELREMKKQARALSGGVYLSVGAIIVIILLLIIIL